MPEHCLRRPHNGFPPRPNYLLCITQPTIPQYLICAVEGTREYSVLKFYKQTFEQLCCASLFPRSVTKANSMKLFMKILAVYNNNFPPAPWPNSPQWTRASSLLRLHHHTQTHHTRWDSSGRVICSTQRPLPDTQHSQQTNIHGPR